MRSNSKNIDNFRKKSTFFQNEINNNANYNKEEKKEEQKKINENKPEDKCDNNIKINLVNKINDNHLDNINPEINNNDIKCIQNKPNIDILNHEIKKLNIGNQNDKDFMSMNNNMQMSNTQSNYTFGQQNMVNNSQINQHKNILENIYVNNNEINQSYNIKNLYQVRNMNSNKNIRNRKIILNSTNSLVDNNNSLNIYQKKSLSTTYNNFLNMTEQPGMSMQMNSVLSTINEKDLFDNCGNLCKEQLECRILEKRLEENPSLASSLIYNKIKDKFHEISLDQFGNYFMQKVIQYLNMEHIKEILYKKIPTHFRCLCFNHHGTRVIQKLFERIVGVEELLNYFTILLTPNIKDFIIDQNANHIIIKYINLVQSPKTNFIIQYIIENIFDLSVKKHSCCVLQKCIEYSDQEQKKLILKAIALKSFGLINDQYGNYVIQYCINVCDYEINKIIAHNFLNDLPRFAVQKYSSNVIEKCLDCCDEETKELIVQKFCEPMLIQKCLFDVYGNYVLQKIMFLSKEPIRSQYIQIISLNDTRICIYKFFLFWYK